MRYTKKISRSSTGCPWLPSANLFSSNDYVRSQSAFRVSFFTGFCENIAWKWEHKIRCLMSFLLLRMSYAVLNFVSVLWFAEWLKAFCYWCFLILQLLTVCFVAVACNCSIDLVEEGRPILVIFTKSWQFQLWQLHIGDGGSSCWSWSWTFDWDIFVYDKAVD